MRAWEMAGPSLPCHPQATSPQRHDAARSTPRASDVVASMRRRGALGRPSRPDHRLNRIPSDCQHRADRHCGSCQLRMKKKKSQSFVPPRPCQRAMHPASADRGKDETRICWRIPNFRGASGVVNPSTRPEHEKKSCIQDVAWPRSFRCCPGPELSDCVATRGQTLRHRRAARHGIARVE